MLHLTDLNTLELLLREPPTLPLRASTLEKYLAAAVSRALSLSLVLRFDLETFDAIEQVFQTGVCDSSKATAWLRLCPRIAALEELRKLELWIDHDDEAEWARVNERAFLSPLDTLTSNKNLNITVNLPKLHPRDEAHDRHFLHNNPPALYTISRRFRQRLHGGYTNDGKRLCVCTNDQFPILYNRHHGDDLDTVEAMERPLWERGENVVDLVHKPQTQLDIPDDQTR